MIKQQIAPGLEIQSGEDGCWIFVTKTATGLRGGININKFGPAKGAFQSWIYEQLGIEHEVVRKTK